MKTFKIRMIADHRLVWRFSRKYQEPKFHPCKIYLSLMYQIQCIMKVLLIYLKIEWLTSSGLIVFVISQETQLTSLTSFEIWCVKRPNQYKKISWGCLARKRQLSIRNGLSDKRLLQKSSTSRMLRRPIKSTWRAQILLTFLLSTFILNLFK